MYEGAGRIVPCIKRRREIVKSRQIVKAAIARADLDNRDTKALSICRCRARLHRDFGPGQGAQDQRLQHTKNHGVGANR